MIRKKVYLRNPWVTPEMLPVQFNILSAIVHLKKTAERELAIVRACAIPVYRVYSFTACHRYADIWKSFVHRR